MERLKNNPLTFLVKKVWKYAEENRRKMVLLLVLSIIAFGLAALEPLILGHLFNTLQGTDLTKQTISRIFTILFLLMLLELGFWLFQWPSRILEGRNAFVVRRNYKNYLLKGTLQMPLIWHKDHHSGETSDKIDRGTGALFAFSARMYEIVQGVMNLIIAFGVMFYFSYQAGLVGLIMSVVAFFVLTFFDVKLVPGYKLVNRMENTVLARIFDALSNINTVIILRAEKQVLNALKDFINRPFNAYDKNNQLNEWKWVTASLMGRLAVIIVTGIYLLFHIGGAFMVGTIYIVYSYASQIRDTFFKFAYIYNDLVRYRAFISNSEDLSKDFTEAALDEPKRLPENWAKLEISNLVFSYRSQEVKNLNLTVPSVIVKKGERVALIGESGSGKSTFLQLFRDLYSPEHLDLSIDNMPVGKGFAAISNSISLIPQEPEVFESTIRENLTLGIEYTDEHIKIFTDMARLTGIIESLPHNLEFYVVEKGANLSGGQKQRLALARGLLASVDKEIILLDEPTSSLDFHNELEIYKNIMNYFPRQVIVASVHRLHLLPLFETVYMFSEGKIAASGSFEELKHTSAEFKNLWEKYLKAREV